MLLKFSNQNSGQLNFHLADNSSGHDLYSSTSLSNSTWYNIVGTYNGTTSKLYVNGSEEASDTVTFTLGNYDTTYGLGIGDKYQTGNEFSGDMDEIRVANAAKSGDWVATEYNNQSSPSTFLTLGSVPSTSTYTSYSYDFRNVLTQTNIGGTVYYYGYDADGQRVKYQTPSLTTLTPTKDYSLESSTPVKYIYGHGRLIATVKDTGGSAVVHYAHTDHLTGSSVISNSSGTQEELFDYYPYGSIRLDEKAGSFGEKHQYIGQLYDNDTGLNYLNARYYHADTGRFMAQDSMFWSLPTSYLVDPQQQNSYSYANNNPITLSDPTGHCPVCIVVGAYLAVYAGPYLNYAGAALQTAYTGTVGYFTVKGIVNKDQEAFNQAGALISMNMGIPEAPVTSSQPRVVNMAKDSGMRFSQVTINPVFSNGNNFDDVVTGLKMGDITPQSFPQVPVAKIQGNAVVGGNRRVAAWSEAGIPRNDWNLRSATPEETLRIQDRLQNNNLGPAGSSKVVVTKNSSAYGVGNLTVVDRPAGSDANVTVRR